MGFFPTSRAAAQRINQNALVIAAMPLGTSANFKLALGAK